MQNSSEITYICFIILFFFIDSISKIRHHIRNHNCLEHSNIRCNKYERKMKFVKKILHYLKYFHLPWTLMSIWQSSYSYASFPYHCEKEMAVFYLKKKKEEKKKLLPLQSIPKGLIGVAGRRFQILLPHSKRLLGRRLLNLSVTTHRWLKAFRVAT